MVPDIHAKFHNQPFIMRRAIWRRVFGQTRRKHDFVLFNCVTGSPPTFDTLLASRYPTYMQSFIISDSSCAEQYGDICLRTDSLARSLTLPLSHSLTRSLAHSLNRSLAHSLTIKPPTAGVQLVGHTSKIPTLIYCM